MNQNPKMRMYTNFKYGFDTVSPKDVSKHGVVSLWYKSANYAKANTINQYKYINNKHTKPFTSYPRTKGCQEYQEQPLVCLAYITENYFCTTRAVVKLYSNSSLIIMLQSFKNKHKLETFVIQIREHPYIAAYWFSSRNSSIAEVSLLRK